MAETYGVYDWRSLPLVTAATLVQGLGSSSRTKKAVTGIKCDDQTLLLAIIADRVGHIAWMFSEDGQNNKNHPPSIYDALRGETETEQAGFDSAEDFIAAWNAIGGDN